MEELHRHKDMHIIYIFYAQIRSAVTRKDTEVPTQPFTCPSILISRSGYGPEVALHNASTCWCSSVTLYTAIWNRGLKNCHTTDEGLTLFPSTLNYTCAVVLQLTRTVRANQTGKLKNQQTPSATHPYADNTVPFQKYNFHFLVVGNRTWLWSQWHLSTVLW